MSTIRVYFLEKNGMPSPRRIRCPCRGVAGYYHFALVGDWGTNMGVDSKSIKPKRVMYDRPDMDTRFLPQEM